MIAAVTLPLILPPLLPVPSLPATSPSAQPVALDEVFAALIASAAPLAPAPQPHAPGARRATLPSAPRPAADAEAALPEPALPEPDIDAALLPLPPVALNPAIAVRLHEPVLAAPMVQSLAPGRTPPALSRAAMPSDREGPALPTPRADAPAIGFVIPIVPNAVTLVARPASSSPPSPSAPSAPDPSSLDRYIQLASGEVTLDAITQDIVASAASTGRARFALTPDTLGRVEVDMAQSASGITVHFATSSRTATDALVTAQPILTESAGAHGIRLAEVQVSTGGAGSDRQPGGHRSRDQIPSQIEAANLSTHPSAHPTSSAPRRSRHAGRFA